MTVLTEEFKNVKVTKEQAQTRITVLPTLVIHEARETLEKIQGEVEPQDLITLSKALGWAEALVYAVDRQTNFVQPMTPFSGNN